MSSLFGILIVIGSTNQSRDKRHVAYLSTMSHFRALTWRMEHHVDISGILLFVRQPFLWVYLIGYIMFHHHWYIANCLDRAGSRASLPKYKRFAQKLTWAFGCSGLYYACKGAEKSSLNNGIDYPYIKPALVSESASTFSLRFIYQVVGLWPTLWSSSCTWVVEQKESLILPAIDAMTESLFFLFAKGVQRAIQVLLEPMSREKKSEEIPRFVFLGIVGNEEKAFSLKNWIKYPDATLADFLLETVPSLSSLKAAFGFIVSLVVLIWLGSTLLYGVKCVNLPWYSDPIGAFLDYISLGASIDNTRLTELLRPWLFLIVGVIITHLVIRILFDLVLLHRKYHKIDLSGSNNVIENVATELYGLIYPLDKLICCMLATELSNMFWSFYVESATKYGRVGHVVFYWVASPFIYLFKRFICNLYIYLPRIGICTPIHTLLLFTFGLAISYLKIIGIGRIKIFLANSDEYGIGAGEMVKEVGSRQIIAPLFLIALALVTRNLKISVKTLHSLWNFIREDLEYSAWTFMAWEWTRLLHNEMQKKRRWGVFDILDYISQYYLITLARPMILEQIDRNVGPIMTFE
jgi:hypothetical protein